MFLRWSPLTKSTSTVLYSWLSSAVVGLPGGTTVLKTNRSCRKALFFRTAAAVWPVLSSIAVGLHTHRVHCVFLVCGIAILVPRWQPEGIAFNLFETRPRLQLTCVLCLTYQTALHFLRYVAAQIHRLLPFRTVRSSRVNLNATSAHGN